MSLYDKVLLKDGRCGWIVEQFDKGDSCMVELDKKGIEDRIITVKNEEILRKIA